MLKRARQSPQTRMLESASVDGITLTEKSYRERLRLPRHSHAENYFCFVLDGRFDEVVNHHTRSCYPSTLIFHPAGETHSDQFHTNTRCFDIQMEKKWLEQTEPRARIRAISGEVRGGRLAHLALQIYREFRAIDQFSSLAIEGLTLEMLTEISRHQTKQARSTPPRWLEQAKEILHERFNDRVTLTALAGLVDAHPAHLAREFHRFYGSTVGEFVRRQRIEFTCRQIRRAEDTLTAIALAAGFFDQSHFVRVFKERVGMTPGQYRSAFRRR